MTAQLQTHAQRDLKRAVELISEFKRREKDAEAHALLTRRAKQFPALVMQVGLAQALAFSAEKKTKDKGHAELLRQVGAILERENVLEHVQTVSATEYMHLTRRVLGAWNYHRRFAVTILGDDDGVNDAD
ncbi:hypothetical protein GCM10017783_22840 [Deinococcus piscis]|uniref:CRISPR type III-B/RAMP module-associated protein Cmr5 n=1 Tax=Deinococcus piscis TaxID=394230 RepID=A0ABQ3K9I3_9DEIO|nr:type III-B CRISPR module-associated protein Cmr5 [Deinococcus piscis]GHG09764.1 hypothetical protein GCM10017783_22840 [Deinococcus piscis]